MTEPSHDVPRAALWLGAAGVLPFAVLALAVWLVPDAWRPLADQMLMGYGVAILSFMGGCRWGFAATGMGQGATWWNLSVSVLPALYAWAVAGLLQDMALPLLALGFLALLWADVTLTRQGGAPLWWPRLRVPLTLGAVVSLGVGSLA